MRTKTRIWRSIALSGIAALGLLAIVGKGPPPTCYEMSFEENREGFVTLPQRVAAWNWSLSADGAGSLALSTVHTDGAGTGERFDDRGEINLNNSDWTDAPPGTEITADSFLSGAKGLGLYTHWFTGDNHGSAVGAMAALEYRLPVPSGCPASVTYWVDLSLDMNRGICVTNSFGSCTHNDSPWLAAMHATFVLGDGSGRMELIGPGRDVLEEEALYYMSAFPGGWTPEHLQEVEQRNSIIFNCDPEECNDPGNRWHYTSEAMVFNVQAGQQASLFVGMNTLYIAPGGTLWTGNHHVFNGDDGMPSADPENHVRLRVGSTSENPLGDGRIRYSIHVFPD